MPIAQEYRSAAIATYQVPAIGADGQRAAYDVPTVPVDVLASKPISLHKAVHAGSIGVKIDPVSLFSGQLRVLL